MPSRPCSVAEISDGLDRGGKERVIVELARRCNPAAVDIHVVSLGRRGALGELIEDAGRRLHVLDRPDGFSPSLVWRLAQFLRANRIDVVHTHDDRAAVHGLAAATLAGIKGRIHTLHRSRIVYGQGQRSKIHLAAHAGRLAKVFVCVSRSSLEMMQEAGVPTAVLKVVPNGVDLSRFSYSGSDPRGAAITVARLSPEKDLATLLQAVARTLDAVPDFRIDIVGGGPSHGELVALAQTLGIADHVAFLGDRSDVPELLRHARMFILSSRTEGLPVSLLEAMACGLPVVATRVGGTPEAVVDRTTGLLVPPADPSALADAIREVWTDPAFAMSLARSARAKAEREFDIDSMIGQYEALYLDASAGRRRP
jgi:glycosyltransferase involved in cell wall biosynthesis